MFIYYNPNIAVHKKNHALPGMKVFSEFFHMYNKTVAILDRTGTIKIPIRVTPLFPVPTLRPMKKTYEEICNERAVELLSRAEKLGVRLFVCWSGGIDSTLVLVSLLKNATAAQKERIVVLLTERSIQENPRFYEEHLRGKLAIDSANTLSYLLGGKDLLVDGELNDQLFGADKVGALIAGFGAGVMHEPYRREIFLRLFGGDAVAVGRHLDLFERLAHAAPISIVSHFDHLWWINFTLKWQSVNLRSLAHVARRNVPHITWDLLETRYAHFFGTEDFQLWSMNNHDKKIKDTWKTYKWPCKDIIYDYTADADYRDNKTKEWSLGFIFAQHQSYNFITKDLKFFDALDPSEYYCRDNDFC